MNLFRREGRRKRLPVVAFAGVLFAFQAIALVGAQVASAAIACTFSGGVITVTASGSGDIVDVQQDGASPGHILVEGADCTGGIALVSNTTAITVTGGALDQQVNLWLSDTTFNQVSWGTINWTLNLGSDGASGDGLAIRNWDTAATSKVNITLGASGIDLDTNADLDVTLSGIENFEVETGGGGDDIINAGGDTTTGAAFPLALDGTDLLNNDCGGGYGVCDYFGGDNTFTGGAGNDLIYVDGGATDYDVLAGGAGDDTLTNFGASEAAADYSSSTTAVTANLTSGVATGQGLDTLNSMNDLIGSAQGDTLTGDTNDNVITGAAGDDKIDCVGAATDEDTADFSDSAAGVVVDLVAGTATGDGTDTLKNCEDVQGSELDDTITGDGNDNGLFGGGGGDSIDGGLGGDTIDGEAGSDWVDYSTRTVAVTVDLTKATVGGTAGACNDASEFVSGDVGGDDDGAVGTGDCLNAIENAALGTGDDTFVGSAFNNTVEPNGGANSLTGGGGADTVDYSVGYDAGVDVNLAGGGGAGTDAFTDTSFVNVIGTAFADSITGNEKSNTIKSRKGSDNVRGGSGDDTVKAGAGNDLVRAGSGDDDLWGQKGNDYLNGGSGDDYCKGGPGKDKLKSCESGHS
jgi:hypothetical protein